MIFSPDMLEKVLAGTKTQTRRPEKAGETCQYNSHWRVRGYDGAPVFMPEYVLNDVKAVYIPSGRIKWELGAIYAVCPGRGTKAVGRIMVEGIRSERPCDISEDDARAEGFDSREAFFDKLRSLYGVNVDLKAPYWVLTIRLVRS